MIGAPIQNSSRLPSPVTTSIIPPTRRRYSAIHSGLPNGPTPPSPVSVWSSFEPRVMHHGVGVVLRDDVEHVLRAS